jgi:SagB-type dehydrogenase family enzyme
MPLLPSVTNSSGPSLEFFEDEALYLATKFNSEYFGPRSTERVRAWLKDPMAQATARAIRPKPSTKKLIRLCPNLTRFRRINWERVVLERESQRSFVKKNISFTELSNLLVMTCAPKDEEGWLPKPTAGSWPKRALPSGGGIYPLEIYVLARNVSGLKPGFYRYDVLGGGLEQVRAGQPKLDETWMQKPLFGEPSALIFVTAVFNRTRAKYGARALKFILLEAGGLGVQMNLAANAMGLGFCFDGGGFDDRWESLLGIDGRSEGLITQFVVGHSEKLKETDGETD